MIKDIEFDVEFPQQGRAPVMAKLAALAGIEDLVLDDNKLRVVYDIRETQLEAVIEFLQHAGASVVLSWYGLWRLRFRCYRESVQAQEANNEIGWDSCVREIYVSRYRHRRHGRRDDRPRHWRQYLNQTK
jgi:hypothetical protein